MKEEGKWKERKTQTDTLSGIQSQTDTHTDKQTEQRDKQSDFDTLIDKN